MKTSLNHHILGLAEQFINSSPIWSFPLGGTSHMRLTDLWQDQDIVVSARAQPAVPWNGFYNAIPGRTG